MNDIRFATTSPAPIQLGEIVTPSGIVLLMDGGLLDLWSGSRTPLLEAGDGGAAAHLVETMNRAVDLELVGDDAEAVGRDRAMQWHPPYFYDYDVPPERVDEMRARIAAIAAEHSYRVGLKVLPARVSHRERAQRALSFGRGAGEVQVHGIYGCVISGLPKDQHLKVMGIPMAHEFTDSWRYVEIVVDPERDLAHSDDVGYVTVDRARIVAADIDALIQWRHHESLDGMADVAFWGRDAEGIASELGAQRQLDGWGWTNLPVEEAERRARQVRRLREERELRFAWDFRPRSHHHAMMEQIRRSEGKAGAGVLDVGGAKLCMFETSWGDGAFPVIRDVDADDHLIRIRVDLGHEKAVENMRRVAALRSSQ